MTRARASYRRRKSFRTAATDRDEEPALEPERPNPPKLGQPGLGPPIVRCRREERLRVVTEKRAWARSHVLDTVLSKPFLHFRERMTVLLGMLILVLQPCLTPVGLILAIAK